MTKVPTSFFRIAPAFTGGGDEILPRSIRGIAAVTQIGAARRGGGLNEIDQSNIIVRPAVDVLIFRFEAGGKTTMQWFPNL